MRFGAVVAVVVMAVAVAKDHRAIGLAAAAVALVLLAVPAAEAAPRFCRELFGGGLLAVALATLVHLRESREYYADLVEVVCIGAAAVCLIGSVLRYAPVPAVLASLILGGSAWTAAYGHALTATGPLIAAVLVLFALVKTDTYRSVPEE
ncbi:hypothetical protein [Actinoplanes sp. NPDC051851]|uniref:hypothetical protein n=1 Tax=Actinoplanes sp. NPDC051851 TaxID=3154753 RepID=UPI003430EBC9